MAIPTGTLHTTLTNVRTAWAQSATFRTLAGAADVNAALSSIHGYGAEDSESLSDDLPRILVWPASWGRRSAPGWEAFGEYYSELQIETPVSTYATHALRAEYFGARMELIVEEMLQAVADDGSILAFPRGETAIEFEEPPFELFEDENRGAMLWSVVFRVHTQG